MSEEPSVWVSLVHHPVLDNKGNVVTTSVTNMDIHDISRTSRTFGIRRFFVVTPVDIHRRMVERIVEIWHEPLRARRLPSRKTALALVRTVESLEAAAAMIEEETGREPELVGTTARRMDGAIGHEDMRTRLHSSPDLPRLIMFGTGWGLAPQALEACSLVLEPVEGVNGYNHLSVRNAAAVILDRLLGKR